MSPTSSRSSLRLSLAVTLALFGANVLHAQQPAVALLFQSANTLTGTIPEPSPLALAAAATCLLVATAHRLLSLRNS